MKKKGFCFKRAVSLLLAAAMILTAAPQTGMTVFAAERGQTENSDTSVDSQALSVDDTLADAGSNENDADGDTAQPEEGLSGDDSTQPPSGGGQDESGDGSENGGDVLPDEPGDQGGPDDTGDGTPGDTEEPEEGTEPAGDQEGDGEDAADIVSEEETVSENTIAAELMAENDALEGSGELGYKGEVKTEQDDGDGWKYNRLIISAAENSEDLLLSDADIVTILEEYAKDESRRFECVQLDMAAAKPADMKLKSKILNAALAVLRTDHKDDEGNPRYWIDYNLYHDASGEWRNFSLNQPWSCGSDINADVKMTPAAGLGVSLKFPAVNFPAEYVSVNVGGDQMEGKIAASLEGAGEENEDWEFRKYSLFTMASGKPAAYVNEGDVWYNPAGSNGSDGNDIYVGNINFLKANTEYLMAAVTDDEESIAAGEMKELKAPENWTGVTWKSYTPDVASINTVSGKTELSAWEEGETLYGVSGKEGTAWKAGFYRMKVERKLARMEFIANALTMEAGEQENLHLNFFPADFDCDQGDSEQIEWEITEQKPLSGSGKVIMFGHYEMEEQKADNPGKGDIIALNPGTATVKATYQKNTSITAECTITVESRLDWDEVREEVESMNLYAVSGCDTKLGDVEFPEGMQGEWKWKDENVSLAPYAGSEGHEFAAVCTKNGVSGEFTVFVRMVNATGIVMQSRRPAEDSQEKAWTEWDRGGVPSILEKDEKLSLGFWFELENCDENVVDEWDTVQEKLRNQYAVEWTTNPKDLGKAQNDGTYEYTASILKKPEKPEKKTFTVSLKDNTTKKVVYKASHSLTVTTGNLFDWGPIQESYYWENLKQDYDSQGKLTSLTLTVKMPKTEYDRWKLTYTSLDNTILQLKTPTVTAGSVKDENDQDIDAAIVKIPCTQKSTGRVWIQITAQDEIKSSERFDMNLENKVPTLLGAATQTINKASTVKSVPIVVSTSEYFPLVKKGDRTPDVSIQEVKIGSKDVSDAFELTDIEELSSPKEGDSTPQTYIGVYRMNLGLRSEKLSELKTGNYTVKLSFKTAALWENNKEEEQTVSLTVKVTDVKPKVTFKQTKKVNLFYTDDEGAGTLQVNTTEGITKLTLENYVDNKNSSKNADCHYELNNEDGVYKIVRKSAQSGAQPDGSLKKGILKYEVAGYAGEFTATFTVATENKAPVIVLSAKSETLYPNVGYTDSWISVIDKATGEAVRLNGEMGDKAYYVVKGAPKQDLVIGAFKHEDPDGNEQKGQETEISCSASGNTYGFFVTDDGNIVSRLRNIDEKNGKKTDTINLELQKNNWSKSVALSYKLQVDNTLKPKLTLGKATLTLNKNADVYREQQERTTLRLKGCGNSVMQDEGSWVNITGQDDKSKAELKGKDSSLVIWYWNDRGDVLVRFNDNKIAPGTYKYKISVGNSDVNDYASTVLTVKIVDKEVKQSLKVTAKGSIDVLDREGTSIAYTPKISNLTGTVVDGRLAGKDANLFESVFEDGKLFVKADEWRKYSTKITYEVHTVFRVQTEDWREYEISSDNDAKAKPFKIKLKQGKPKLTAAAAGGNTIYRQRDNRVDIRIEAVLGKQEVEIEDVRLLNYWGDLFLEPTQIKEWSGDYLLMSEESECYIYNPETKSVRVALQDVYNCEEIRKNGTYKLKLAVRYRDKASDMKEAEVTVPIVIK